VSQRKEIGKMNVNRLVVDLDGTLAVGGCYPEIGPPHAGACEAMDALKQAGLEVVISTARFYGLDDEALDAEIERVRSWLERWEIPYSKIDNGRQGKVPALFYVDDRAIAFHPREKTWNQIRVEILNPSV
jgi:hypothetical protein